MEPSAKPEWQTPSLVPLTGVRDSAAAKVPFYTEYTSTTLPVAQPMGVPDPTAPLS